MPGHVKKSEGPDPDPSPWLLVSEELKVKLKAKPYDAKKSCWVPDKATGGYDEGLIESIDGEKVSVKILHSGDTKVFKKAQVGQVNPPKFDCSDDMASLTYLNDACVLWNSVVRYKNELIYTYSGLFCIAINPYKRFPIYTQRAMEIYMGLRRNECPPHIFGVAEGSYQGMMNVGKNQSILITGESGAGKTENTKKVIAYFASIGASGKKKEGEPGLEDKIVQTNPVLEAWGNAKTVRNDNSSRFGKFIRIWFNAGGKLSGADMVIYLLEKSRLTFQAELERCYHSFYNIMSDQVPDIKGKCHLSDNIYDYWWVSQGKTTVPSIDDKEDMMFAHEAYNILGFSEEETYNIYKLTAVVMHMGNLTKDFVPVGKEEQAEVKNDANAIKVADICGIDCEWMVTYFCKPKLKVGTEWVSKGQTCDGAASSVGGIGRSIYERVFTFIMNKCNETLFDPTMKKVQYIGCLDIAGFEIFDYNGFEQICINFANEKLQQFFNQHMFTLEQEEYVREGLDWANVDFGMDLQKCITMFEKPMGLLAILEEESLFPKATDQTFAAKLHENLLGKCENFAKPAPKPDPNAHFAVVHYAATVSYNLTGWLFKNKDPLNDTIVEMFKNGSNNLLIECFADHPGQPVEVKKEAGGKKKGGGKTVSSFYKSQLDDLMKTLYATDPAFIRCVVPNTHKQPGGVEPGLVMHQYQCNGVLAGIAICRAGFPNKIVYPEFKERYNILAAAAVAKAKKDKDAAKAVFKAIKLEEEKFRLGHTKVFFRAGILGYMEEVREDRIGMVLSWLQAQARGKASRLLFKKLQDQKLALYCMQRTIRNYYIGKTWLWWQLWLLIKPNLKCTKFAQWVADYEEKIALAEANIDKATAECNKEKDVHKRLNNEKNELVLALQGGSNAVQEIIDKTNRVEAQKNDLQKQLDDTLARVRAEDDAIANLSAQKTKVMVDADKLKGDVMTLESTLEATEEDKLTKDGQIRTLKEEIIHQEDMVSKLQKEKRGVGDSRQKTEEDIQANEDKCNHLNKVKNKLEQELDETEDTLEREKKCRGDVEKLKRKVDGDLKLTQEATNDMERIKSELEQSITRKEKEITSMTAKIDDELTLSSKYNNQIKELQQRIEQLDEELTIERSNRAKAEKNRTALSRDIGDLAEKLEDSGNNTTTLIELNKKREANLAKLKAQLDESNVAHEGTLAALRQKHNNNMAEMGEQIDNLNKMKTKAEKDKGGMERDLQEARAALDEGMRDKANHERNSKLTAALIVEANQKLDDMARALNEADSSKKKLQVENSDLSRQIDEVEAAIAALGKTKISLTTQLADTKRMGDTEARDRAGLLAKFKNLSTELENLRDRIDNESEKKQDALKALSKAQAEIALWKSKFETEGMGRIEELEGGRNKLTSRLSEADETIDSLKQKISSTEKSKNRMESELEELQMEYERVHAAAIITEKRGRNFDKVIGEWKAKADDLVDNIDASQKECRNYNSEIFRLKAAWDEATQQLDIVKRENKNLADEIKDLLDQLGDGGRSINELDKQRRRLEVEKEELQAALEEAEASLEQEENKVLESQLELAQARQEIEKKIQEKIQEFENNRKNHGRAMDSSQASLDAESKAKAEALRIKKKLENDINELEIALDHANKANAEAHKSVKGYQNQLREVEGYLTEEKRQRQEINEKSGLVDRRAMALEDELEEARSLLDSADRGKKQADNELAAARESVNDMHIINSKAATEKRGLESNVHTIHAEIDDVLLQAKNADEATKRAMVDAERLANELKVEQAHAHKQTMAKRALGNKIAEVGVNLGEANDVAAAAGRNAMAKLESRISQLEIELGTIQTKTSETHKAFQKSDRHIKELQFQGVHDAKLHQRRSLEVTQLQDKIKKLKDQLDEAENIAAVNLAKYQKSKKDLEDAERKGKFNAGLKA